VLPVVIDIMTVVQEDLWSFVPW